MLFHFSLGGLPPGLQPIHKSSIVMFLERVYGIDDQSTFFRLLEDCFLADLRAATTLDMVSFFAIQNVHCLSMFCLVQSTIGDIYLIFLCMKHLLQCSLVSSL